MTDWERVRNDFPITRELVYLNSASSGPVSRPVRDAAVKFYEQMMRRGDETWDLWMARREEARRRVAQLINADPDEIGFTTNTSTGMNTIIDAFERVEEVISCDLEFPVSTIPWMHRGVRVHLLKTEGQFQATDIERYRTSQTNVICISHVQYSNGFRADLEEIGRSKGEGFLVVNASQAAGAFEIDVKRMQIDALCTTGHKWMLAGYGSGFVYLSRRLLENTSPRQIGWLSVEEPFAMRNDDYRVQRSAGVRTELGCPHFAGIFTLGASVKNLLTIGMANIQSRVLYLNRYLTSQLAEGGWRVPSPSNEESVRSGETLVQFDNPKELTRYLASRRIAVTEKPQGIRVATHFFNNEEDIDRLVSALREAQSEGIVG